tara:strand:+ start:387 stop:635 length:249 start_codon:yes stop_codon:yes gene_type:complete
MREFVLQIYYQGEMIELREFKQAGYQPNKGDEIYLTFENDNYSKEYGNWWQVKKRKFLLPRTDSSMEVLQLFCEPCEPSDNW